jgi:ABC-type multidrug transport system fused ATPase/permease subunit
MRGGACILWVFYTATPPLVQRQSTLRQKTILFCLAAGRMLNGRRMKTCAELGFPGRLIAVEGLDGSGKSTQIYLLKRWLELQGLKVFFSEWNSSELVKNATSKGKTRSA